MIAASHPQRLAIVVAACIAIRQSELSNIGQSMCNHVGSYTFRPLPFFFIEYIIFTEIPLIIFWAVWVMAVHAATFPT
jgi:hypothetical protein